MTDKNNTTDFEQLAEKAEYAAKHQLGLYKFKLFLYALLGYLVIFATLASLFGLIGCIVGMAFYSTALLLLLVKSKLILVIIPMIWVLLKSLWVRFDKPCGYRLTRKQCPALFADINRLRKQLKAPRIHQVIMTSELNAAIVQTPRLGVFGWPRNTLILGLELLLTLSPKEARAVLAHEYGHLSGNHGRFTGWIYRVRQTWYRIMQAFQSNNSLGARMMRKFFNWYAPNFAAYSFALARINEYEADAIAASLTSPASAGGALITTYVSGPYVDENYWQTYFRKADELSQPDHTPWAGLSSFLKTHEPATEELSKRLEQEMARETSYDDTHPSLNDRLTAIRCKAAIPKPGGKTAAEVWLGEQYASILKDFDENWIEVNATAWRERHDYVQSSMAQLAEIESMEDGTLDDEMLWSKARLTEEFGNPVDAEALYRRLQERYPENAEVAFCIGRLVFEKDDDELLRQMKIAQGRNDLVVDACQYAYYYLLRAERADEAEWWKTRAEDKLKIDAAAEQEREHLTTRDMLIYYEPDIEVLSHIIKTLEKHPRIKKAWLAKKVVKHYPEVPALAIAVIGKGLLVKADRLIEELSGQLELSCTLYIVPKAGGYKALAKKIIKVGERIV